MKALITGSSGFIGSHLTEELVNNGYDVVKCDLKSSHDTVVMDIMDQQMIKMVLEEQKPDIIINMAGQANVGLSWQNPQLTVQLNTIGFINILEAVRNIDRKIKIIAIGSADEYGRLGGRGINVTEDIPVNPVTPYALSKLTQEQFAKLYISTYGLNICMIRLFNLGGAGQKKGYMISDFASGIAEIESGRKKFLLVGNLESARDFTHVKDACVAVRLIIEKGHTGEIYNICSGNTHTAQEILDKLIELAKAQIDIQQDPSRLRPSDTPVICGNHDKLTSHTGWVPERNIDEILKDAIDYWRDQNQ